MRMGTSWPSPWRRLARASLFPSSCDAEQTLPGRGYWREWEEFVRRRMLNAGFISEEDLCFFKIVEDIEGAVAEIKGFYSNYHSHRFVRQDLVVRLLHPPTQSLIAKLNRDFRDMLTE